MPLELVDRILDEIGGDSAVVLYRKTLKSCSLVCKSWIHRSSAYLFRSIEVCAPQLEQYLAFAKTSPRLRTHVLEFTVNGTIDVTLHLDDIFAATPGLTTLELWSNMTQRFARPPDFETGDIEDPKALYYYTKAPTGTHPARGGTIDINRLTLSSMSILSAALTIRPFKRIGTLELRAIRQAVRVDSRTVVQRYGRLLPLHPHPAVDHLIINGCWDSNIAFMLAWTPLQPTSLTIHGITYKDMFSFLGFIKDTGAEIEQVSLFSVGSFLYPAYDGNGAPISRTVCA